MGGRILRRGRRAAGSACGCRLRRSLGTGGHGVSIAVVCKRKDRATYHVDRYSSGIRIGSDEVSSDVCQYVL